jgi:hypothetical protein
MKIIITTLITIIVLLVTTTPGISASVKTRGDKIYIIDRTGERWDVTDAAKRGFRPDKFQYGIGKTAFTPLKNEDLTDEQLPKSSRARIIGINIGEDSHAYSIKRLRNHEIANTTIADKAIAVGY